MRDTGRDGTDGEQLSKISWLPDILVFRSSIIPTVIAPVLVVTAFSAAVAAISLWWGKEVGLANNVGERARTATAYLTKKGIVPLLSVVVGLLLGEY